MDNLFRKCKELVRFFDPAIVQERTFLCFMQVNEMSKALAAKLDKNVSFVCVCVYVCVFLGPHLWHMEIPRLGVESEL